MQQIVFLDSDTLDAGINLRRPDFPHHWQSYPETRPEQVVERLSCASIAIINKVRIGAAELARLPDLKLIALAATGSDNLDLEACRAANVGVCNIRNYSGPSVPEHAMALMLALSRNLFAWRQSLLEGRWQQSGQFCFFDHPITDLHRHRHVTGGLAHAGDQASHERLIGSQAAIHLPVACDEFLFHDDHVKTILPVCWLDSISAWACAASAAAKVR